MWEREISPGCASEPPPTNPAWEAVWWGERKGAPGHQGLGAVQQPGDAVDARGCCSLVGGDAGGRGGNHFNLIILSPGPPLEPCLLAGYLGALHHDSQLLDRSRLAHGHQPAIRRGLNLLR